MINRTHRIIPSWTCLDENKQTLTTLELFDEGMKYCDTKSWKIRFLTQTLSKLIDELNLDTTTVLRILELEDALTRYLKMIKNGLVFYDNYCLYQRVSECAYHLWLNGSEDTERNWLAAEQALKLVLNKC